jgi:hypothetical protein
VSFHHTTQRNTPEDTCLHTHRRDNLKTQPISLKFFLGTESIGVSRFVPLGHMAAECEKMIIVENIQGQQVAVTASHCLKFWKENW